MKKYISFKSYKLGLALLFLSAGSMSFAQRGGRGGGERQNNPQRSAPQHQARPMPSVENRQRQLPGAATMDRSRTGQVQGQRPSEHRSPAIRPTAERPVTQRRGETPRNNPGRVGQQPSVQRPSVNNNRPVESRWNNRNIRPTNDNNRNRITANNNRNYSNGNRNYNNRNYRNGNYYRPRPHYNRPPVIWQGRRYYTHYNYAYHPYRPYYYGSFYHPFGYFMSSLAASAIWYTWNDQYYGYDQGVYYQPYNSGYRVIPAPVGAYVTYLPNGYSTIQVDGDTFYYFAGTFYVTGAGGRYEIVTPPSGAVVYDLPEGAKEVTINDTVYLEYNGTYYQPISLDGKNAYEVVDTEEDDNF